jgi:hypothetical protein
LIALALASICVGFAAAAHPDGLGLGLMAGEPDGFSAKLWTSPHVALDAGLGYSWWDYDALQIHGDVLFHTHNLIDREDGYLPFYIGVGARVKLANDAYPKPYPSRVGLRIPFGLEYVFTGAPVGIFFELVPILDLTGQTGFSWNSAVGIRYYFSSNNND